jgi:hypothetical protein
MTLSTACFCCIVLLRNAVYCPENAAPACFPDFNGGAMVFFLNLITIVAQDVAGGAAAL